MPTITFSLKDLQNLVGKKLTLDEIKELAYYGKGDFEGYDKSTDELKIDFEDIPAEVTRSRLYFYTAALSVFF